MCQTINFRIGELHRVIAYPIRIVRLYMVSYNRFLMALRQTSLEDAKEVLLEIEQQVLLQNSDMYTAQLLLSPLFSIILSFLSEKEININDVLDNDPVLYPNIFLQFIEKIIHLT